MLLKPLLNGILDITLFPFCHLKHIHWCFLFVFSRQDGVVDPMDSTLRDFCGRCIEEFVKWSIKQTTPKQQEKSPTNMKSLFKRIYSLALHPNGFKRLGAALAFNSIYRQFRYDTFVFVEPQVKMVLCYHIVGQLYCICSMLSTICPCREEGALVEQFIFEVLVIFVESLALAHSDERSMGNCFSTLAFRQETQIFISLSVTMFTCK